MKILFVLLQLNDENKGDGMYISLAQEFREHGHEVTIIAPDNCHKKTYLGKEYDMRILRVGSFATQGVKRMLAKGFALALLPFFYKKAYKRFLAREKFDWVVMPTPPITLSRFVDFVKRKSGSKFYLILRDIHPQSIWSIGLLKNNLLYKYLDMYASYGYKTADIIACMSQGNIDFIKSHYQDVDKSKFTILYNWMRNINVKDANFDVRAKYNLRGKFLVVYGGNLGKGQRVENIAFLARNYLNNPHIAFIIIGKGVEKDRLIQISNSQGLSNIRFIDFMPQKDYLQFIASADIGLISINENYAVPTCPSKAISYMALGVPMLAMINQNNDYGKWIEDAGVGYWAVASDYEKIVRLFAELYGNSALRDKMSSNGKNYFKNNCTSQKAYEKVINQMSDNDNE